MTTLIIPSARQPVVITDANGNTAFTRPWFLFFQRLLERIGGSSGEPIPDLIESADNGDSSAENSQALYALRDQLESLPPQSQALFEFMAGELQTVRDELAELRKDVEGLQQGTQL